jgi:hypothetical protein
MTAGSTSWSCPRTTRVVGGQRPRSWILECIYRMMLVTSVSPNPAIRPPEAGTITERFL